MSIIIYHAILFIKKGLAPCFHDFAIHVEVQAVLGWILTKYHIRIDHNNMNSSLLINL